MEVKNEEDAVVNHYGYFFCLCNPGDISSRTGSG